MERSLSGIKDIDQLILYNLNDEDLLEIISLNKYLNSVADELFWRKRLLQKYPNVIINETISWKDNYLKVIYYVDKMKREFDFTFTEGNPKNYYDILSYWDNKWKNNDTLTTTAGRMLLEKGYDDIFLFITNNVMPSGHMELGDADWELYKKFIFFSKKYVSEDTKFLEKY